MDNHTHSSHPNSRDSSPRSRELMENDNNNNNASSFDEPPPSNTYRVKLMCSYGGKIQPRPHDNQLAYVGGDTKILAVERNVKFPTIVSKLSSLANSDVCFKYQLPGEDLDSLISVTNDEDLDHMMVEYDRLTSASPKPARLRLFLFPLNNNGRGSVSATIDLVVDSKQERQWFVDALNSVQVPPREGSSPPPPPPPPPPNPDFLFGLDKPYQTAPAVKRADSPQKVPDFSAKDSVAGSECGSETVRETEIQEMQKLQLGNNEHQRKSDGENGRVYGGVDCYSQNNCDKLTPLATHAPARVNSGSFPVQASGPVSVSVPASFLAERNNGYTLGVSANGTEPTPVYLIQTQNGIYQAVRPVTGPVGQPVYFIQTPQLGSEVGGAVSERGHSRVAYFPDMSALPRQAAAAPGGDGWK